MDKLGIALALSATAHRDQKYGDYPYFLHPMRVMRKIAETGHQDEATLIAAVLHDVVEDTDVSFADIREQFGKEVAEAIAAVTRHAEGPESYAEFIQRAAAHPRGRLIKRADVTDHLEQGAEGSLGERYLKALEVLSPALGLQYYASVDEGYFKLRPSFDEKGPKLSLLLARKSTGIDPDPEAQGSALRDFMEVNDVHSWMCSSSCDFTEENGVSEEIWARFMKAAGLES